MADSFNLGADLRTAEDAGNVEVTITRTGDLLSQTIIVGSLSNGSPRNNALAGSDYLEISDLEVHFAEGEDSATVEVSIIDDSFYELDERFFLRILNVGAGNTVVGNTLIITIDENDFYPLAWDEGEQDVPSAGESLFESGLMSSAAVTYFRVITGNAELWRTRLTVTQGEADLELHQGAFLAEDDPDYASATLGSDGLLLLDSQFNSSQAWYIRVTSTANSEWSLFSGEVYVRDQGGLVDENDTAYSPLEFTIPPEGAVFFRATPREGAKAWALWLNGYEQSSELSTIAVQKNQPGVPDIDGLNARQFDFQQRDKMLLVPPYFGDLSDTYFVSLFGNPGDEVEVDSHLITPEAISVASTTSNVTQRSTGAPFAIFELDVPESYIAWDTVLNNIDVGDPNLAVRQGFVPSQWENGAFSEALGSIAQDSVTLVPPTLTDGTWFATVYSDGAFQADLVNGQPEDTGALIDIDFTDDDSRLENPIYQPGPGPVDTPQPSRVGWVFFRADKIGEQSGLLGWDLELLNEKPDTELALRQNAVPGRIFNRSTSSGARRLEVESTSIRQINSFDLVTDRGFLQRPSQQSDIWYVGVHLNNQTIGDFQLERRELLPIIASPEDYSVSVTNHLPDTWQFYRFDIEDGILGWETRMKNVVGGNPRLIVRRALLPNVVNATSLSTSDSFANTGSAVTNANDWFARSLGEQYRSLLLTERQLFTETDSEITYYVGIFNDSDEATSYDFTSVVVDDDTSPYGVVEPITSIDFDGGAESIIDLFDEALYYSLDVPENVSSWRLRLASTVGDARISVRRDFLPDYSSSIGGDAEQNGGIEMEREGDDVYHLLPEGGNILEAGRYYIAVVPERGMNFSGTLISEGEIPITHIGEGPLSYSYNIPADELELLEFDLPSGAYAIEISLDQSIGDSNLSIHDGIEILAPHLIFPRNSNGHRYGYDGGNNPNRSADFSTIFEAPEAGTYSLTLRANRLSSIVPLASSGTFNIRIIEEPPAETALPIEFEGGSATVVGHEPRTWRYFEVTVPEDGVIEGDSDAILGWNPRITSVQEGSNVLMTVVKGEFFEDNRFFVTSNLGFSGSPSQNTSWPDGANWSEAHNYSIRSNIDGSSISHHSLVAPWGRPLDGGTYFIAVYNNSTTTGASYTATSRTIGEQGSSSSLTVQDIPFNDGQVVEANLPAREHSFYRITIPAGGVKSWRARLENAVGDSFFNVRANALPDFISSFYFSNSPNSENPFDERSNAGGGIVVDRAGDECYTLLPEELEENIPGGTVFYIAATSAGTSPINTSSFSSGGASFTFLSEGELSTSEVEFVNNVYTEDDVLFKAGEIKLYTFEVPVFPEGVETSLEIELTDETGNNVNFALRKGDLIPEPYSTSRPYFHSYGVDEGTDNLSSFETSIQTIIEPEPGVYTLALRSELLSDDSSTADLRIEILTPRTLDFCAGAVVQSDQPAGAWRYFEVIVPNDPDLDGWDLSIDPDYVGGNLSLYTRKVNLPFYTGISGESRTSTAWRDGRQIVSSGSDWTGDPTHFNGNTISSTRDLFQYNRPLVPGRYFVGVRNSSTTESSSYTIRSRCIGVSGSAPIVSMDDEVVPLNFAGAGNSVFIPSVAPHQAKYFCVEVPEETRSWRVRLDSTAPEETTLVINKDHIPSFNVDERSDADTNGGAIRMRRIGDEIYTLLPDNLQTYVPAGTYYLAVVGMGDNGEAIANVGENAVSATLTSEGELIEASLGTLGAIPGAQLTAGIDLEASEISLYTFTIPEDPSLQNEGVIELRLDNRVGDPYMSLRSDNFIPSPQSTVFQRYGFDNGSSAEQRSNQLITLVNPEPGTYTLTLNAFSSSSNPVDAEAELVITNVGVSSLAFDPRSATSPASVTADIIDGQRRFYKVDVPEFLTSEDGNEDIPILAWKLSLEETNGDARMRIMTEFGDRGGVTTSPSDDIAIITTPVLAPGRSFYIEVLANGLATFTLESSAEEYEGVWSLPTAYNQSFGTTGDVDLAEDDWHFYAVDVPEGNGGILRTELVAISGNPNLYIREDGVPTLNHDTNVDIRTGTIVDRDLIGSDTEYANWVPIDGRSENQLAPGRWVIGVRAHNVNSRYDLILSSGDVEIIDYETLQKFGDPANRNEFENERILSEDFKYYRVEIPELEQTPEDLAATFMEISGDVTLHIRDTIPPGNSTGLPGRFDPIIDAATDNKNDWGYWNTTFTSSGIDDPGTTQFSFPELRPGETYFIAMRGKIDGTYNLDLAPSTALASTNYGTVETIAFVGEFEGHDYLVPAGGTQTIRVQVPADATKWVSTHTHSSDVRIYLEQGTFPEPSERRLHYASLFNRANSSLTQDLDGWPWLPGEDYYILIENNGDVDEIVNITISGEGASFPYGEWAAGHGLSGSELDYNSDLDRDGIPNLLEFVLNGDPEVADRPLILPRINSVGDGRTFSYTRIADSTAMTTQTLWYSYNLTDWFELSASELNSILSVNPIPESDGALERVSYDLTPLDPENEGIFVQLGVELNF